MEGKTIEHLKVTELRAELEAKGLDRTGTKQVLANRLKEFLIQNGEDPVSYRFYCDLSLKDSQTMQEETSVEVSKPSSEVVSQDDYEPNQTPESHNNGQSVNFFEQHVASLNDDEIETIENEIKSETENLVSVHASKPESVIEDENEDEVPSGKIADKEEPISCVVRIEDQEDLDYDIDAPNDEGNNHQNSSEGLNKKSSRISKCVDKLEGSVSSKKLEKNSPKLEKIDKERLDDQPGSSKGNQSTNASSIPKALWVGNISKSTKAAELKQLFSKHGKVISASIVMRAGSGCFGYLSLHSNEDAKKCIEALNGKEWNGIKLKVEFTSREAPAKKGDKKEQRPSTSTSNKPSASDLNKAKVLAKVHERKSRMRISVPQKPIAINSSSLRAKHLLNNASRSRPGVSFTSNKMLRTSRNFNSLLNKQFPQPSRGRGRSRQPPRRNSPPPRILSPRRDVRQVIERLKAEKRSTFKRLRTSDSIRSPPSRSARLRSPIRSRDPPRIIPGASLLSRRSPILKRSRSPPSSLRRPPPAPSGRDRSPARRYPRGARDFIESSGSTRYRMMGRTPPRERSPQHQKYSDISVSSRSSSYLRPVERHPELVRRRSPERYSTRARLSPPIIERRREPIYEPEYHSSEYRRRMIESSREPQPSLYESRRPAGSPRRSYPQEKDRRMPPPSSLDRRQAPSRYSPPNQRRSNHMYLDDRIMSSQDVQQRKSYYTTNRTSNDISTRPMGYVYSQSPDRRPSVSNRGRSPISRSIPPEAPYSSQYELGNSSNRRIPAADIASYHSSREYAAPRQRSISPPDDRRPLYEDRHRRSSPPQSRVLNSFIAAAQKTYPPTDSNERRHGGSSSNSYNNPMQSSSGSRSSNSRWNTAVVDIEYGHQHRTSGGSSNTYLQQSDSFNPLHAIHSSNTQSQWIGLNLPPQSHHQTSSSSKYH